jgi:alpha-L-fucosidase
MLAAVLQKHKYESGATIDKKSWGYRRNTNFTTDFLTIDNLVWQLVSTVRYVHKDCKCMLGMLTDRCSCGGNLLVNIGATADGRIIPIFEERLRQMGKLASTHECRQGSAWRSMKSLQWLKIIQATALLCLCNVLYSYVGSWLSRNGEAIYKTKPWQYQNDTINNNVWYVPISSLELNTSITQNKIQ